MEQFLCVLSFYELNKKVVRSHREIKQALTCDIVLDVAAKANPSISYSYT